ncbi:putative protein kinase RLK-Pelle-RLCK-XI family [Dioscorea sansibarensis]
MTTTVLRRFSYSQLRRATGSFSPSHRLGQGGFGPVFRGELSSGQKVAVKVMDAGSLQGEREFQNELSLAEKMALSDRCWIVPPLGYCYSEEKQSLWRRFKRKDDNDDDEEQAPVRRILLVYDLMHNGSLQDALLDRRCPELADWHRRFSVAVDIARGLQFLHSICDPAVIHGDIKPSNILLDSNLSARIADFGLARFKNSITDEPAAVAPQLDEEDVVEIEVDDDDVDDEGEIGSKAEKSKRIDDDTSVITITTISVDKSPEETPWSPVETTGLEAASTSETAGFDRMSADSGGRRSGRKKTGSVLSGKDWWWRQDTGGASSDAGSSSVKDYVMEWIRSEIKKERPKSDWIAATPTASSEGSKPRQPERKKHSKRLEWWASLDEERIKKKEKSRPAREWWREEFCEELTNKHKRKMLAKSLSNVEAGEHQWWQKDEETTTRKKKKKKKKKSWSRSSMDGWIEGNNGEVRIAGRRSSRDWASIDIPRSGTISSTPSMRGTVCYVAPEYGGGGPLSEKCDIYSFGVLLLVLISGRRPLQVTASPMSEFERANLISWARNLAHLGRLFDLVDPLLRAVDRDQVLVCITVALLCIQRSPVRRPSSKEIVAMLSGQSEPPNLPLEFSPSPPGGFTFNSRKQ